RAGASWWQPAPERTRPPGSGTLQDEFAHDALAFPQSTQRICRSAAAEDRPLHRQASVPSPKSLAYLAESSWAMARRDDDDVSRRYFEEEQRSQGPRGPARWARDFGDGTLDGGASPWIPHRNS